MDYGYSNTGYGAQGPAGGGGFMNMGSQEGQGAKVKRETLRPVTIKQINDAQQSNPDSETYTVSGSDMSQLTFVGQIQNISRQALNTIYRFDDGTGSVEVKLWADPESKEVMENGTVEDLTAKLTENSYARVFGTIKSFGNKRHVGARPGGIRPITDMNEVQYHMLESTAVHLQLTRGPLDGMDKGGQEQQQTNGNGAAANGGGDMQINGKPLPAGLSTVAKKVYKCLMNTPQTNEGLHCQDIAAQLSLDPGDVRRANDELIENGLSYTTVDDNTWAILDDQ